MPPSAVLTPSTDSCRRFLIAIQSEIKETGDLVSPPNTAAFLSKKITHAQTSTDSKLQSQQGQLEQPLNYQKAAL